MSLAPETRLTLGQLRTFLAVASTGSVRAAADQLVVTQPTKTTLSSKGNPATYGQKGSITATVKIVPPGSIPTGDVEFYVNGSLLETQSLDGNGKAKMPIADLEVGSYSIVANYLGDASFDPSTSKALSQAVDPANTSVDLASSMNPAPQGSAGAITATVKPVPPGGGTPTGTITFKIDGVAQPPVALNNGKAKLKLKKLTVGSHVIVVGIASGRTVCSTRGKIFCITTPRAAPAIPPTNPMAAA